MSGHSSQQEEAGKKDVCHHPVLTFPHTTPDMLTPYSHYLSAIEDRMKRMESAMNASGIAIDDGDPEAAIPAVSAQSALEDKLSIFMISDDGAAGFVGPSSGFSLFSPQGLRWISEKTGDNNFEQVIKAVSSSCEHQASSGQDTFRPLPESEREPLPPKDIANEYMAAYFDNFNNSFPLYDKESVMERFSRDYYMVNREKDPAWYASLNVIFLIGRSITMHEREANGLCEKYFRNAASVFIELLFNGPSLLAVQAMVGMVSSRLNYHSVFTNNNRPLSCKRQKTHIHHICLWAWQHDLPKQSVSIGV